MSTYLICILCIRTICIIYKFYPLVTINTLITFEKQLIYERNILVSYIIPYAQIKENITANMGLI